MAATKRLVVRSATVGIEDATLDDFSATATLVGAPNTAKIVSTGGSVYNPITQEADTTFNNQVTFTWTEEV